MNYNCQQQQPFIVLPSIQSMLGGVRASPYYYHSHDALLVKEKTKSLYHPKPLEPSLNSMYTTVNQSSSLGHIRTQSDVGPSIMHCHQHHKRSTSEHNFDYAQKQQQKQYIIPGFYHDQQDSVDSSFECLTPPFSYYSSNNRIRLQGKSLNKHICSHCHKRFSRPSSLL
ncbi:hypothetical protein INT46_004526 [Mucor plumbeus]|uniref:Uncharacterized protein n=1 Tax=Mucor plumbeus TaxID=97098 RepID=A0A8H7QX05_9FUNG|nr:hypothetical protein INT46_004526 [Mucor plumbeus]